MEPLLKSEDYNETVSAAIARRLTGWPKAATAMRKIRRGWMRFESLQDPQRELGFGFLYKEQVY